MYVNKIIFYIIGYHFPLMAVLMNNYCMLYTHHLHRSARSEISLQLRREKNKLKWIPTYLS